MGFFDKQNASSPETPEQDYRKHYLRDRCGDFVLTDAIRLHSYATVLLEEGYRFSSYCVPNSTREVPVVMAAASREKLFRLFMNLLEPLGDMVTVFLNRNHEDADCKRTSWTREDIDLSVRKSQLWDYEDLLLHDGKAGIAVINMNSSQEVQFDSHKLLYVYGNQLDAYLNILNRRIPLHQKMYSVADVDHIHLSQPQHEQRFEKLKTTLGAEQENLSQTMDNLCQSSILNQQVTWDHVFLSYNGSVLDDAFAHAFPSNMAISAMRTGTPFFACRK